MWPAPVWIPHLFPNIHAAGSGSVPACAAIGGLPCRPARPTLPNTNRQHHTKNTPHPLPNTTRQHHAKYTPNPAYSTQHITLTEKTVPIQKQTALNTRCNQERRDALGLAGIIPISSINAASSRLSTTANLRLVGHPRRVK